MVKCSDCGLLALKNTNISQWVEADEVYRATGEVVAPSGKADPLPICFTRKWNLRVGIKAQLLRDGYGEVEAEARSRGSISGRILAEITRERSCETTNQSQPGFIKWSQGFSPKEHREMLDRQWRLGRERDWRKEDQDWLTSEREARERHEKSTRGNHRLEIGLLGVGILVAAVIAVFAALIEAGIIFEREPQIVPVEEHRIEVPVTVEVPVTITPVPPSPTPGIVVGSPQVTQ